MSHDTRKALLDAALDTFDSVGFERATVARIRGEAGVSNGSFFHFFGSKEALAAALYVEVLAAYHAAMTAALAPRARGAQGVRALVRTHLDWVAVNARQAKFLFEQARPEWLESVRPLQQQENQAFGAAIERWRAPLIARGELRPMPFALFISQIIGPAQIFCRAWLAGRSETDPRIYATALAKCALRALCATVRSKGDSK